MPTPHVRIDREVLERNIDAMRLAAEAAGLALRPHAKTHKSLEVARLQLAAGAIGLTVATVSEAEVFAEGLRRPLRRVPLGRRRRSGRRGVSSTRPW